MELEKIFDDSEGLAEELTRAIDRPPFSDAPRIVYAAVACSLALEHWHAVRLLLQNGLLPTAAVVHRAQFEATVRSVWLTYAASDLDVMKLSSELNTDTEQAAKGVAQVQAMMLEIKQRAPEQAFAALDRIKMHSWKALNSYAHAGLHPLRRHADGYPVPLIQSMLCNANGVAVVSCMQAVVLQGEQPRQKEILEIALRFPHCMPPLI